MSDGINHGQKIDYCGTCQFPVGICRCVSFTRLEDRPNGQSLQEWAEMAEMTIDSYHNQIVDTNAIKSCIRKRVAELKAEQEKCWEAVYSAANRMREIEKEGNDLLNEALALRASSEKTF